MKILRRKSLPKNKDFYSESYLLGLTQGYKSWFRDCKETLTDKLFRIYVDKQEGTRLLCYRGYTFPIHYDKNAGMEYIECDGLSWCSLSYLDMTDFLDDVLFERDLRLSDSEFENEYKIYL